MLAFFGSSAAEAVNFRMQLLQDGDLPDAVLERIEVPTLVLASAKDRLLPSMQEGTLPVVPVA